MNPVPAFKVVELPEQNEVPPLIDVVGFERTVVVAEAVPIHPLLLVTVTVKVAALLTEIVCVVAPVDHA